MPWFYALSDKDNQNKSYHKQGVSLLESLNTQGGQVPGIPARPRGVSLLEKPENLEKFGGHLAATGGQSKMEWGVNARRNSHLGFQTPAAYAA